MKKLEDYNWFMEEVDSWLYPGQTPGVLVVFLNGEGNINGKIKSGVDVVNDAYLSMIHRAVSCMGFHNGSWLNDVSYKTFDYIKNQKEEDYDLDIEAMNFLFSLKIACNESIKNKDVPYFLWYEEEFNDYTITIGEEEIDKTMKECTDNE